MLFSHYLLWSLQVFSTLSFSASNVFSKVSRNFDVVIIDEAAQAVRVKSSLV
jgi:superfamily I DNA and/or RNA helicase